MGLKIIYKNLFFTHLTQSKKMGYNDWIEFSGCAGSSLKQATDRD
jgi:hypothetical protein